MLASLLAAGSPLPAVAQEVYAFNISSQDSSSALRAFSMQSGMQILASAEDLQGKVLNPVQGTVALEQALVDMLAGTGLSHRYVGARAVALVSAASTRPIVVAAQVVPPPERQTNQSPGDTIIAVDEVLVTARRREENLQDVPIAISALGAQNLEERGVQTIEQMNSQTPNLMVMGGGNTGDGSAFFRVRGMPGVAVYIDGVDQPQTDGLLTMGVVEIDRIEVLRGPQGTLFGNASLGGAVSYVTRAPADTFGARIRATVGSLSRRDVQAAVDIPVTDTFKTKLTAASAYRDGYMSSVVIDKKYGDTNDELLRADFLWTPIDAVSVRYNVEKSDTNRNGPARAVGEIGTRELYTVGSRQFSSYFQSQIYANVGIDFSNVAQVAGYPGGNLGEYETRIAWDEPGQVIDVMRHTLDVNWSINDTFSIRSISGYKDLTRYTQPDLDVSSDVTINNRDTATRQFSFGQELQLLGVHERANWVLGAYYQQQYNRTRTNQRILAEFTCDLWLDQDVANRRITIEQQANCMNLRARAVGLSGTFANSSMTRAQIAGAARAALTAASNAAGPYNGITLGNFTGAVGTTSDGLSFERPESRAVFGDLTFRLTDQLSVAAGIRYSEDESDGTVNIGTGNNRQFLASFNGLELSGLTPNLFGWRGELPTPNNPTKYDALTKRLTVQYRWNPDLMTYVSYSDGFGPGGVSQVATVIPNYLTLNAAGVATGGYARDIFNAGLNDIPLISTRGEQTVKNYEIGMRADWFNGTLRTNVTAFWTDWSNVPTSYPAATLYWDVDGNGFADSQVDIDGDGINDVFRFPNLFTVAAEEAVAKGVEIETNWRASDNLRLNLNLGYLKTEYTKLGDAGIGVLPAIEEGTVFAGAPEITAAFGMAYEFPMANGAGLTPRLDYVYTDDFSLQASEQTQRIQKGFGLLNARLTYESGANWSINLSGANLTNEYYYNSGQYAAATQSSFVTVGRPREYALMFDFRFD